MFMSALKRTNSNVFLTRAEKTSLTSFAALKTFIFKNRRIGMKGVTLNRTYKIQTFEREGRENLAAVIKNVKNYLKGLITNGIPYPTRIVFFTLQGEGPMLAYNQLSELELTIIAVTFPLTYSIVREDKSIYRPEIPDKVQKFFKGVGIPVLRGRLPFDDMGGADSHNKEMGMLKNALSLFGGSIPLAIQAVLQATDNGHIPQGEEVIAVTADTALLVTASTTRDFLSKTCGLVVNEIICKPRNFNISRPAPKPTSEPEILSPSIRGGKQIEGRRFRDD